jgi:hypothetical protein
MTSLDSAERAHRCLRSVWVIVSAMNDDAVAKDVETMGKKLAAAIEGRDAIACENAMEEVREWLSTSAGVVLGRLQYVFEKP